MPCTNTIEKGYMSRGPIAEGDCSATVLGSRHAGEQLRSLTDSTKTQLPYSKCKFIAEVLSCCQYVLVCQNVKQFSNFHSCTNH